MKYNKYDNMQIEQLKRLHEQVELRRNRVKNVAFMNEIKENQTRDTYKLEYNRIRNALANSLTPYDTKETIKRRMNTLNKLIAKAL